MSTNEGRVDGHVVRTAPAGSLDPEQNWSVPNDEYVQSWLGEARAKFREHRHARAIGRVVEAHTMQRIIRLVMRIQEQEGYADQLRRERDEARAELAQALEIGKDAEGRLDYRRAEVAQHRLNLEAAEEEIRHLKAHADADHQIFKGEQFLLKKALDYLEKLNGVLKDADEDFNFSGDHDPDGAPDA